MTAVDVVEDHDLIRLVVARVSAAGQVRALAGVLARLPVGERDRR